MQSPHMGACPKTCVSGECRLIAAVDGLRGLPEGINAAFPLTRVQTCIVHLVRRSLIFCSSKDRKVVSGDRNAIYRAETAAAFKRRHMGIEDSP